jgi:hypothetical protein
VLDPLLGRNLIKKGKYVCTVQSAFKLWNSNAALLSGSLRETIQHNQSKG